MANKPKVRIRNGFSAATRRCQAPDGVDWTTPVCLAARAGGVLRARVQAERDDHDGREQHDDSSVDGQTSVYGKGPWWWLASPLPRGLRALRGRGATTTAGPARTTNRPSSGVRSAGNVMPPSDAVRDSLIGRPQPQVLLLHECLSWWWAGTAFSSSPHDLACAGGETAVEDLPVAA